ncbi:MAG: nucleoside-diphosphate kinase [Patescibacteria group bacterium]|nr:MAG: nucleoside-diphosphate kinase [Patescibacteria group bacterium]
MIEKTFVLLKPDAVKRGLVGNIISRFERVGLKIVACKFIQPSRELAEKHYPLERREFVEGIGKKTLENYREMGIDPVKEIGVSDPYEIGKIVRGWLIDFIISDPVLAIVLEGPGAVEIVRKLVGHTLPVKADPGTIRGDLSFDSAFFANAKKRPIKNLIHASGNFEEAEYEISLWFTKDEIYNYKRAEEEVMY